LPISIDDRSGGYHRMLEGSFNFVTHIYFRSFGYEGTVFAEGFRRLSLVMVSASKSCQQY
jgi:hypothetical protein